MVFNVFKIIFFSGFILVFLSSCSSRYDAIKVSKFEQKSYALECDSLKYTLYIGENDYTINGKQKKMDDKISDIKTEQKEVKFALLNSLGVPVVSRVFKNGKFKNSKFLPPNAKFDPIFIGILETIRNNYKSATIKDKNLVCKVSEI